MSGEATATTTTSGGTATAEASSAPATPATETETSTTSPADAQIPAENTGGLTPEERPAEAEAADEQNSGGEQAVDPALLAQAKEHGFSEADAKALGPQGLAAVVAAVDRRMSALGQQVLDAQTQPAKPAVEGQAAPAPAATPPAQAAPAQLPPEGFKWELPAEEFDDRLLGNLNKFDQHVSSQFKAVQGVLDGLMAVERQRQQAVLEQKFDAQLDKLGAEWEPVYGKGAIEDKNSEAFKARAAVWSEMRAMAAGYQAHNIPVPPFEQLITRAARALHGDKAQAKVGEGVRKSIASTLDKRRGAMMPRPSHRTPSNAPHDPDADAKAFVEDYFKNRE